MKYMIENRESGAMLGTYEAETEDQALDKMAQDAGYKDYSDLLDNVPDSSKDELMITGLDAETITEYVMKNIDTDSPGTSSLINIYAGPNGLTHTFDSMEYRDDEHVHVVSFELKNEHAPYSGEEIESIISQQLKAQKK